MVSFKKRNDERHHKENEKIRQTWRKVFASHIPDKGFVSRIHKNS